MQYRIGVIGATGYIGTPYRKEIRESTYDAKIVAVCARRLDRLQQAAEQDGAHVVSDDWQKIVECPDVNMVLVLTPDACHYEPVMACAELGKHVLCEKPIGKDVQQAAAMWRAVRKWQIASFVPYWTRYVPVFRRAKQLVEDGLLGAIRGVVYRWHNPRPVAMPYTWRDDATQSSAGSIADVGSHAYDTLRFILGEEATRVLTHAHVMMPPKADAGDLNLAEALQWGEQHPDPADDRRRRGSVPDYAQLAVEFPSGAVGCLLLSHASYVRKGFAPELELHGSKASLSVDRIRGQLKFSDNPQPAQPYLSVDDDGYCNRFQEHVFPAFDEQLNGRPSTQPTLYDGWRVQTFTDAAITSAQRRTWVDLAELAGEEE